MTLLYGAINSNELDRIEIARLGMNNYLNAKNTYTIPIRKEKSFCGSLPLSTAEMFRIGDGYFGHQVFITPGDTVQFSFKLIHRTSTNNSHNTAPLPTFHNMHVKTRYPGNYTYFDAIGSFFGSTVKPFDQNHIVPSRFKASCDSAYQAAKKLLHFYYQRKLVSDTFFKYATAELDAKYVLWICTPLTYIKKSTLPPNYFENIQDTAFSNNDALLRTDSYMTAASVYNTYVLNDFNPMIWYSNLNGEFHSASTYFHGLSRDRLMGWCLTDYKDKGFRSFDSLYQFFKSCCSNTRIKNEVISDIESFRERERNEPPFNELIEKAVVNTLDHKKSSFKKLLQGKKWVILDCWASWCVPCRKQLPYLNAFEKKYRDSIDFIYLSFDQDAAAWQQFIKKNNYNPKNQFHLEGGFNSEFAKYFNVLTIPRYIMINTRDLLIVSKDMPLPIQKEGFDTIIFNALSNSN